GRQDQQGVDDQQAYPGHGHGDHHGNGHGEDGLLPEHLDAPAVSQGGVDGGEHQSVEGAQPQHYHHQQNNRQQGDLSRFHTEDITDEQTVELGKAAAVKGGDKDAQSHGGGGEHTNHRVAGHVGLTLNVGKEQGKGGGQQNGGPHGVGHTA